MEFYKIDPCWQLRQNTKWQLLHTTRRSSDKIPIPQPDNKQVFRAGLPDFS
jgi:hypothetical protein